MIERLRFSSHIRHLSACLFCGLKERLLLGLWFLLQDKDPPSPSSCTYCICSASLDSIPLTKGMTRRAQLTSPKLFEVYTFTVPSRCSWITSHVKCHRLKSAWLLHSGVVLHAIPSQHLETFWLQLFIWTVRPFKEFCPCFVFDWCSLLGRFFLFTCTEGAQKSAVLSNTYSLPLGLDMAPKGPSGW